jgi:hypothetical protein
VTVAVHQPLGNKMDADIDQKTYSDEDNRSANPADLRNRQHDVGTDEDASANTQLQPTIDVVCKNAERETLAAGAELFFDLVPERRAAQGELNALIELRARQPLVQADPESDILVN